MVYPEGIALKQAKRKSTVILIYNIPILLNGKSQDKTKGKLAGTCNQRANAIDAFIISSFLLSYLQG